MGTYKKEKLVKMSFCKLNVHLDVMFYDVYHKDKKSWEEVISCFLYTLILLFDTANRKELQRVCIMKSIKQYSLRSFSADTKIITSKI
jgi:hypothetical protein